MRDNDTGEFYPEPPTFRCRRCGEVEHHKTADCTEECCESCEDFIEGQQDRGIKLSDLVMGLIAKAKEQVK